MIEGKDGCCKDVYNTVYQKLKAKKHKNIAEYRYYRNFTIGQKTGYEEVRWEWVQRLHTAGMNEDKISEILTYPQKEVERLLIMKKKTSKAGSRIIGKMKTQGKSIRLVSDPEAKENC